MVKASKDDIITYLKKNKRFFKKEFGVRDIGIFGSLITDSRVKGSDIDIIIEMEKDKKNIHNFLNFKRFLENQLQTEIDLGLADALKPAIKEEIEDKIIYV
ncbi:MAG: nucleotidyltransferase domain-containing protein [Candidatus Omnitrophica bacterium]|nr:nucleotidyltransferase domain-containing protein [Candidatus Omnitrophota bacterium]